MFSKVKRVLERDNPVIVNLLILFITVLAVTTGVATVINTNRQQQCNQEFVDAFSRRAVENANFQDATHSLVMGVIALDRPLDVYSPEYAEYAEQTRVLFYEFDGSYQRLKEVRDQSPLPICG